MEKQEILALLPAGFSENSRVWIYQSSRNFEPQEVSEINEQLSHFYLQWAAHGQPVKGWGQLLLNRFIVMIADEAASNMVSGCSTDGMVRIIKSIERQYKVDLFDRMTLTFWVKNKVQALPLNQLEYAMNNQFIDVDTLYFNNTVTTLKDMNTDWLAPLKDTWLMERVQ